MLIAVLWVFVKLLELLPFPQNQVHYSFKCCSMYCLLIELSYLNVNTFTFFLQYTSTDSRDLSAVSLPFEFNHWPVLSADRGRGNAAPGLDRLRWLSQSAFNHHTCNIYPSVYTFYFRSSQRLTCYRSRVGFVHSNYYVGLMCKLILYYLMYFIFQ